MRKVKQGIQSQFGYCGKYIVALGLAGLNVKMAAMIRCFSVRHIAIID